MALLGVCASCLSRLGWFKGWWPLVVIVHSLNELDELLQWLCCDDSIVNIVLVITIT